MEEINLENLAKYKFRKTYRSGMGSIAITATGLLKSDTEYVCWIDEKTGDIIFREKQMVGKKLCSRCHLPFKPEDEEQTMCRECIGEHRLQDYEENLMEKGTVT